MEYNAQAFPKSGVLVTEEGRMSIEGTEDGMTLLDYFAAKAMQAIVSKMYEPKEPHLACVEDAYKIAHHMLETRKNYIP